MPAPVAGLWRRIGAFTVRYWFWHGQLPGQGEFSFVGPGLMGLALNLVGVLPYLRGLTFLAIGSYTNTTRAEALAHCTLAAAMARGQKTDRRQS